MSASASRTPAVVSLSARDFATLAWRKLAYVRVARSEDVGFFCPEAPLLAPGQDVFVVYAADGTPIFVRPLALQLVNAPLVGPPEPRPILAAPELLGPIGALNAARGARGEAAYKSLEGDPSLFAGARDQDAPPFARFALDCEQRPDSVTLSWTLSAERRDYMRQRAEAALSGGSTRGDDVRLLAWLDRLEGGTAPATTAPDGCGDRTAAEAMLAHASP